MALRLLGVDVGLRDEPRGRSDRVELGHSPPVSAADCADLEPQAEPRRLQHVTRLQHRHSSSSRGRLPAQYVASVRTSVLDSSNFASPSSGHTGRVDRSTPATPPATTRRSASPPTRSSSRSSTATERAARAPARGAPARDVRAAGRVRRRRRSRREQTAERKLREKTGVGSVHLEQLRTYAAAATATRAAGCRRSPTWRWSRPRRCRRSGPADREASWHPVDALPELALDHARIVDDGAVAAARPASPTRPGSCAWPAACSRAVHARPGPAALRGAARRAGRRRELPPRRRAPPACWRRRASALRGPRPAGPGVPPVR